MRDDLFGWNCLFVTSVTNMKSSKYNFIFFLEEDRYLIYNALSGGLAKVDLDTLKLIKSLKKEKSTNEDDPEISLILSNLKEGRFIVPNDFDEVAHLEVLTNLHRFGSRTLGLTVTPTLECNFRCKYCYEDQVNIRMNPETIAALEQFLKKQIDDLGALGIAWFGGEPLLAVDVMEHISSFIFELQKKKDFHYESGIITNGYLMDRRMAGKLMDLKMTKIQVTIDGPPDVHDSRRPLKNGKGTFQRILDNLLEITDILKGISIRVNVDSSNVDRVPELLDILRSENLKDKVGIYFSPVQVFSNVCKDVSGDCLSHEVFSEHEITLFNKAVEKGFRIWKYPSPLYGYCGAVNFHSLVIDALGDFHKCWNTVGIKSEAVGALGDPLEMSTNLLQWLSWNPFKNEECRICKFLPICMGGCPYLLRTRDKNCDPWKFNLEKMLSLYYTSKSKSESS